MRLAKMSSRETDRGDRGSHVTHQLLLLEAARHNASFHVREVIFRVAEPIFSNSHGTRFRAKRKFIREVADVREMLQSERERESGATPNVPYKFQITSPKNLAWV